MSWRTAAWIYSRRSHKRAGITLATRVNTKFTTTGHVYGWHNALDGSCSSHCSSRQAASRSQETRALRHIAEKFARRVPPDGNQNVLIANVGESDKAAVTRCSPNMA